MKIIDRRSFLAMPPGTVFCKYEPVIFGEILIKEESLENDFFYTQTISAIDGDSPGDIFEMLENSKESGSSFNMDFDCVSRDGMFDDEGLFVVFEEKDVIMLIDKLSRTAKTVKICGHSDCVHFKENSHLCKECNLNSSGCYYDKD